MWRGRREPDGCEADHCACDCLASRADRRGTDGRHADPPVAGNVVVQLADSQYGQILVDAAGMTLYGEVLEGASGIPTCKDQCLERWPPLIVSGDFTVGEGLDQSIFTTVERQLGTQLQAGDYPLYRSADDEAPGDTNGQGAGQGFWFVVGADGELIKE